MTDHKSWPKEYRYRATASYTALKGLSRLLLVVVPCIFLISLSMERVTAIVAAVVSISIVISLFLIIYPLYGQHVHYTGTVLRLDDVGVRFTPNRRVVVTIPWRRIIYVHPQRKKRAVASLSIKYLTPQGRLAEIGLPVILLDGDWSVIVSVIEQYAASHAGAWNQPVPRSKRGSKTARRTLFWFGFVTWIFPSCVMLSVFIIQEFLRLISGEEVADRFHEAMLEPRFSALGVGILGTLGCLGTLSIIFWVWLIAKDFAEEAEKSRGGKLSRAARVFAAGFSTLSLSGGALIGVLAWNDPYLWEKSSKIFYYACGFGLFGFWYCVIRGVNPDAPEDIN